jgi:hypothetical protein
MFLVVVLNPLLEARDSGPEQKQWAGSDKTDLVQRDAAASKTCVWRVSFHDCALVTCVIRMYCPQLLGADTGN